MNTGDKTPEQFLDEMKRTPWKIVKEQPDYHTMALLAAQTLPNQSAAELLANADKIEAWLMGPKYDARKVHEEFRKAFEEYPRFNEVHKKSPEKINPEASDGVSGD